MRVASLSQRRRKSQNSSTSNKRLGALAHEKAQPRVEKLCTIHGG